MARYHVFSALHKYYGNAYEGKWLKEINQPIPKAEFSNFEAAKSCADELHKICDSGWIVYNAFSELPMYDSRTEQSKTVNN